MATTYKIIRFYADSERGKGKRVVARGLTLKEAQKHCKDPETSSRTATRPSAKTRTRRYGAWFDGYTEEKGD
jgi:hypothetical protein